MADPHTSQPLSTLHADLITSLAFSHSAPSLLASTSLDGWIRIHGRTQGTRHQAGDGNISNGTNGHQDTRMVEHDGSGQDGSDEDGWTEVGGIKANEGPVWRAIWGPREYGTTLLVSIAGSVVHIWGARSLLCLGRARHYARQAGLRTRLPGIQTDRRLSLLFDVRFQQRRDCVA